MGGGHKGWQPRVWQRPRAWASRAEAALGQPNTFTSFPFLRRRGFSWEQLPSVL